MGKTFYTETDEGGIVFYTERKIGEVRIPNYVYDMWLPLLGACALGVYATYCRLEMGGSVKKITLSDLARSFHIGTGKLNQINAQLQECGFIRVQKPTGNARLMHWTTEIVVQDPPTKISQELLDKYAPHGYEILTPWLMEPPEMPNDISGEVNVTPPNESVATSNIESLDILQPLNVEYPPSAEIPRCPVEEEPSVTETPEDRVREMTLKAMGQYFASNQNRPPISVPADAGGADDWLEPVMAFLEVTGQAAPADKVRRRWARVFEQVGAQWQVGPRAVAAAVRKKPESEIGWKVWTTPHAARGDLAFLLGQHLNGGIRPSRRNGGAKQTRGDRNREIIEGWFQPEWVDFGDGVEVKV